MRDQAGSLAVLLTFALFPLPGTLAQRVGASTRNDTAEELHERPLELPVARPHTSAARFAHLIGTQPARVWSLGPYHSIQVNVDAQGNDTVNDAANEPSMAVDPTNPQRIVIGWRQFDTIFDPNAFRQAGVAYSHNGGATWTATTLDLGQFRSDPVLAADNQGNFFYSSLSSLISVEVFKSVNGGVSWLAPVGAFGGDKQWMTVDRTGGIGDGIIYQTWNTQFSCCPPDDFTRSFDGGASFPASYQIPTPSLKWGTIDVGPDGELFAVGTSGDGLQYVLAKSATANTPEPPIWSFVRYVDLGGIVGVGTGPNPGGLLGQSWVVTDHSTGQTRGNVYLLSSVDPPGSDPLDVMFVRSTDGGDTFSPPIRVNDDLPGPAAYQWFGSMSIAPKGRIDAIYYDTQVDPITTVRYTASYDAGTTWAPSIPITPSFDRSVGYPNQPKIGDYCQLNSDDLGVSLAYAATYNGGQDVYFLRISLDCNENGISDDCDVSCGPAGSRCDVPGCGLFSDCNANTIPDVCEPDEDCNVNSIQDICDIASGKSDDCNLNNRPDECESPGDCNGNGENDFCDIASAFSSDCNANEIPDDCDIASESSADTNADGLPDECQGACCAHGECHDVMMSECQGIDDEFSGLGILCGGKGACEPIPPPVNDYCADAIRMPSELHVIVTVDNLGASVDGNATSDCAPFPDRLFGTDIWYQYVAPCTGPVEVNTCNSVSFNAILEVYGGESGCVCPPTEYRNCANGNCPTTGERLFFNATAGRCYLIRVGGIESDQGTGEFELSNSTSCAIGPTRPEPDGDYNKTRFISLRLPENALPEFRSVAIRVTLSSLHHVDPPYAGGPSVPFSAFEGQVRWVSPPTQYSEGGSNPAIFLASALQCTPHYQEWDTISVLHILGSAIVPSSAYDVQTFASACQDIEEECPMISDPLRLETTRWGDVSPPFSPPDLTDQPDFNDISALVNKFKNAPGAPIKARALLAGTNANGEIDPTLDLGFTHISACVDAFKGLPYPYQIAGCP